MIETRRKEASALLSGYVIASAAFFTEYGKLATSTKDLGKYLSIGGCNTNNNRICRKSTFGNEDYTNLEITKWYSWSGHYEIEMKSENDQNIFIATASGKF